MMLEMVCKRSKVYLFRIAQVCERMCASRQRIEGLLGQIGVPADEVDEHVELVFSP